MSATEAFFDTNVVLYLFSRDEARAGRSEDLIAQGGHVSVQVLNELAAVARRKLGMSWREVREISGRLRAVCAVQALTVETHARGLHLAKAMNIGLYDAMILASALLAGCNVLYTEDLQDGRIVDGQLAIRNPFR